MESARIREALNWRYATKRFDATRKISAEDWDTLRASLVMAPSSYGLQPWKFLNIESPETRARLKEASWGQGQVVDASHLVVFAYKEQIDPEYIQKYIRRIAEVRGVPLESLDSYRDLMVERLIKGPRSKAIPLWASRQAYLAMGFLLETAALLKVDACPLEGLEPEEYDRILGLANSGWRTAAAVVLGYRHPEDKYQVLKKVRFPEELVVETVK